MGNNRATKQMKNKLTLSFVAIVMMATMASCTKTDTPYNPIDYISIPRAEYRGNNGIVTQARYSISNQSNKTLYYCLFRVTQCTEEGIAYYSQVYEIGDKNNIYAWTLPSGDIQLTNYYDVNFTHSENGHIKDEIIDARFY